MKSPFSHFIVVGSAIVAFTLVSIVGNVRPAASSSIPTTGDVGLVPQSSMVRLQPATASDVTVSPDIAIQRATTEWKLAPGQIDQSIGLVRADATVNWNPLHQHEKVWLMVVDLPTASPASGVRYSRLIVVVDGKIGRYLYAYPVEPKLVQYRKVFGAHQGTDRGRGRSSSSSMRRQA